MRCSSRRRRYSARTWVWLSEGLPAPTLARLHWALTPTGTAVNIGGEEGGSFSGGVNRQLRGLAVSRLISKRQSFIATQRAADYERLTDLIEAGKLTPSTGNPGLAVAAPNVVAAFGVRRPASARASPGQRTAGRDESRRAADGELLRLALLVQATAPRDRTVDQRARPLIITVGQLQPYQADSSVRRGCLAGLDQPCGDAHPHPVRA